MLTPFEQFFLEEILNKGEDLSVIQSFQNLQGIIQKRQQEKKEEDRKLFFSPPIVAYARNSTDLDFNDGDKDFLNDEPKSFIPLSSSSSSLSPNTSRSRKRKKTRRMLRVSHVTPSSGTQQAAAATIPVTTSPGFSELRKLFDELDSEELVCDDQGEEGRRRSANTSKKNKMKAVPVSSAPWPSRRRAQKV
jgi:hypothetical protein